jgi:hypothetical protein
LTSCPQILLWTSLMNTAWLKQRPKFAIKVLLVAVSSGVISSIGIRCSLATVLTTYVMINEVNTVLYTTRLSNGNDAKLKHFHPTLIKINKQESKGWRSENILYYNKNYSDYLCKRKSTKLRHSEFLSTTQNRNHVGLATLIILVSTRHPSEAFVFACLFWDFTIHQKVLAPYVWVANLSLVIPPIEECTVHFRSPLFITLYVEVSVYTSKTPASGIWHLVVKVWTSTAKENF